MRWFALKFWFSENPDMSSLICGTISTVDGLVWLTGSRRISGRHKGRGDSVQSHRFLQHGGCLRLEAF